MESYSEKPIRIDYYPKTKEDTDGLEELEIEDNLVRGADCKITNKEGFIKEKIAKCNSCIAKDVKVMEEVIEEVMEETMEDSEGTIIEEAEDMQEVIEEVTEDKEEN